MYFYSVVTRCCLLSLSPISVREKANASALWERIRCAIVQSKYLEKCCKRRYLGMEYFASLSKAAMNGRDRDEFKQLLGKWRLAAPHSASTLVQQGTKAKFSCKPPTSRHSLGLSSVPRTPCLRLLRGLVWSCMLAKYFSNQSLPCPIIYTNKGT